MTLGKLTARGHGNEQPAPYPQQLWATLVAIAVVLVLGHETAGRCPGPMVNRAWRTLTRVARG